MTLVTAKTQKPCIRVYVRAHEKILAPIILHLSTPYFHSPSFSYKFSNISTFFFNSSRFLPLLISTSHKTTSRFSKTTSHFSQNDGSLFTKRRVVFSPKQDTRCTTTKLTDIYSLGKSSHSINLSSRKYQEENRRINLAQR